MSERSTWVEVRRDALIANLRAVARHARVPVCAVVKANAYGHGLTETAKVFSRAGARMLAVTRIEEARALREAGVGSPVLIMAPVPDPKEAIELRCAVTVAAVEQITALPAEAEVHLKIDTGMGRLGVRPHEALEAARAVGRRARLGGVWTHFADATGTGGPAQLARFQRAVEALRDDGVAFTAHAANSAALLALSESRQDMVRVGTLLYGNDPIGAQAPWEHAETLRWFARAVAVRTLPPGTPVGYGSEWRASKGARVATLPVGYTDGFGVDPNARTPSLARAAKRLASTAIRRDDRVVTFDGRPARVIGRVAMQAVTVDVTELADVEEGSVARLRGRRMMISPTIERVMT